MAKFKLVRIVETQYGTYSLHFTTPSGRRRRLSVGKDNQHVQRLEVRINDWLIEGKDPEVELEKAERIEKVKRTTLREFFPIFMDKHGNILSKSMIEIYHQRFKNIDRCLQMVDIYHWGISLES